MIMYYLKKYNKTISILIIITILSLINTSKIQPKDIELIPHFDKIIHFLMYFTLAFFFMFEYYLHHKKGITKISQILILPILWGGFMELMQYFTTSNRSADWWDMVANTLGIFIAYLVVVGFRKNLIIKKLILFPFGKFSKN